MVFLCLLVNYIISHTSVLDTTERYLAKEFDVKDHANYLLQSGIAISEQLAKISEGILLLNKGLHSQVVAHHDDLLSQATGVETLEGINS